LFRYGHGGLGPGSTSYWIGLISHSSFQAKSYVSAFSLDLEGLSFVIHPRPGLRLRSWPFPTLNWLIVCLKFLLHQTMWVNKYLDLVSYSWQAHNSTRSRSKLYVAKLRIYSLLFIIYIWKEFHPRNSPTSSLTQSDRLMIDDRWSYRWRINGEGLNYVEFSICLLLWYGFHLLIRLLFTRCCLWSKETPTHPIKFTALISRTRIYSVQCTTRVDHTTSRPSTLQRPISIFCHCARSNYRTEHH